MPQFNHFETKSGQQIDPTFGLNALSEETKRKTKAREQMNIAANVIRQSLAADGKGLTKGTEVNIEEGGQYTFNGDNAAKDETNLYNIRKANYGKTGTGNISKTYEVQDGAQQKAMDFVSGANQQQRNLMDIVANKAASVAAGGSPKTTLPNGTTLPPGTSMRAGASNEASIDAGSATSSGQTLLQKDTNRSVQVDDDLQMNQSDLAVASAMEALNSQVYGTTNPGVYQKLMDQNKATSAAKNAANILEDHSSEQVAGRQFNQHQDFGRAQFSQRQDQSAGGGSTTKQPDQYKTYYTPSNGDDAKVKYNPSTGKLEFAPGENKQIALTEQNSIKLQSENGGATDKPRAAGGWGRDNASNGLVDYLATKADDSFGTDYVNDLGIVPRETAAYKKHMEGLSAPPDDGKFRYRLYKGKLTLYEGSEPQISYKKSVSTRALVDGKFVDIDNSNKANSNIWAGEVVTPSGKIKQNTVDRMLHNGR